MPDSTAPATSSIQENVAGLLCYLLWWVTGLIFYLVDTRKFVRFHAMQSILTFVAITIIFIILSILLIIPVLGLLLYLLAGLATFILWIFLMIQAYQGKMYKLPVIGDYADKWSNK